MATRYRHTQIGYLIIILMDIAIMCVIGWIIFEGGWWAPYTVLGILVLAEVLFASLVVSISDGYLKLRFGIGLISKRYNLNPIESCEVVRNKWYYGWGIRLTPHGWLYNVSGLKAVQVKLKTGKTFRVGTDEPEALCEALGLLIHPDT